MMFFSIIVPVYNRPKQIEELLESLLAQIYKQFEVIIVEDGSQMDCREILASFESKLDCHYLYQSNSGQGFARNLGMDHARGDYFVLFDSDCIIPSDYLLNLKSALLARNLDAHGGPDAAAENFSPFQKAVDFSMTAFWTTGGIRGKLKDPTKYQARGYNMGFSKRVYEVTGGFVDPCKAEDIELSIRIKNAGFRLELVEEAFVYHKRRGDFIDFIRQCFSFGRNRINVGRYHKNAVKPIHYAPLVFLLAMLSMPVLFLLYNNIFAIISAIFLLWLMVIAVSAALKYRSISVGLLAVFTSILQLSAYGAGLAYEGIIKRYKS